MVWFNTLSGVRQTFVFCGGHACRVVYHPDIELLGLYVLGQTPVKLGQALAHMGYVLFIRTQVKAPARSEVHELIRNAQRSGSFPRAA